MAWQNIQDNTYRMIILLQQRYTSIVSGWNSWKKLAAPSFDLGTSGLWALRAIPAAPCCCCTTPGCVATITCISINELHPRLSPDLLQLLPMLCHADFFAQRAHVQADSEAQRLTRSLWSFLTPRAPLWVPSPLLWFRQPMWRCNSVYRAMLPRIVYSRRPMDKDKVRKS